VTPAPTLVPATSVEKRLLWLVRDLVQQSNSVFDESQTFDGPIPVFSQFIGVYAEAIALLAEYGLVTDLTDNGGRAVGGKLLSVGESAAVLKTDPWDDSKIESGEREFPSEEALARGIGAFFRPLLERLRKAAK
jgi:hypothetical protein